MPTVGDIDLSGQVKKYLNRPVTSNREDESTDLLSEIDAVLESISITFLLYPQIVLSFIMRAKNTLRRIVTKDIEIINFIASNLEELNGSNDRITDSSDLLEAQTALLELDRIGRIETDSPAFIRYSDSVSRFLNNHLSKFLKRRLSRSFEKSGLEARIDLFESFNLFIAVHGVLSERLKFLKSSISDYRSVSLSRKVYRKTLLRVRSSLSALKRGVDNNNLSKQVLAIELLSGISALKSVAGDRDVFDPTIQTSKFPIGRKIELRPVSGSKSETVSSTGPWDISGESLPYTFSITVDPNRTPGIFLSKEFPASKSGVVSSYLYSSASETGLFEVPVNSSLYLLMEGAGTPYTAINITSGTRTGVQVAADIDSGLVTKGSCIFNPTSKTFLIQGDSSITNIHVLVSSGFSSGNISAHSLLGFFGSSSPLSVITPTALYLFLTDLSNLIESEVIDNKVIIRSATSTKYSSLLFGTGIAGALGFNSSVVELNPKAMEFVEDGLVLDPIELGVFLGSRVQAKETWTSPSRKLDHPVDTITHTYIAFSPSVSLPRETLPVVVIDPLVNVVKELLNSLEKITTFDNDVFRLQQTIIPLLKQATRAEIGDAKKVISDIRTRLMSLSDVLREEVRDDRTKNGQTANLILSVLEERSLDRSAELLLSAQFSSFFGTSSASASHGINFLRGLESVARNNFPITTAEEDIEEYDVLGRNISVDGVLPALEPFVGDNLNTDSEPDG